MELQRQQLASHAIQAYQAHELIIADKSYHHSVLVSAQELQSPWPKFEEFAFQDFEVVILGDDNLDRLRYLELQLSLSQQGIGCEIMNLGAACRTFNLLLAEGRQVLGLFRLDESC